jgi:hypothetical protein
MQRSFLSLLSWKFRGNSACQKSNKSRTSRPTWVRKGKMPSRMRLLCKFKRPQIRIPIRRLMGDMDGCKLEWHSQSTPLRGVKQLYALLSPFSGHGVLIQGIVILNIPSLLPLSLRIPLCHLHRLRLHRRSPIRSRPHNRTPRNLHRS